MAPTWIATIPDARTTCGGLRISTSSPYALCHQSSNGTEKAMANAPQMATHAPRGPRNPQKRTERPTWASEPANVVFKTIHPQVSPATAAPICSRTWGGLQSVSRPMDMCQEMSQRRPTMMHAEAKRSV